MEMNNHERRRGEKDLEFPPLAKCLILASTLNSIYIYIYIYIIINTLYKTLPFLLLNKSTQNHADIPDKYIFQ